MSAGAALLGGAQRRARPSVDPDLIVTVTVPWMPLLPARMDAGSTIPELQTVRANQLRIGYASNVVLPPRKEATKKPLQTAKRRLQSALVQSQQHGATEDLDLKIEIAQMQIKSYLLQTHLDGFGKSRSGVALVKGNQHTKKAVHREQTRVATLANSNKVTEQTPPAKITRSQMQGFVHQQEEVVVLLDHLLDGGDVQDFDKQSNDAPPTSKRPKRAANTVDYCDTRDPFPTLIRERVKVAPRVACRPDELLNDGWCLVIKSDASNTGAGACLLLVKCEDARHVTEEMLADPQRVKLISTLSKVLSEDEKKWLTFEQEAYGMYLALRKWGVGKLKNYVSRTGFGAKEGVCNSHLGLYTNLDPQISRFRTTLGASPMSVSACHLGHFFAILETQVSEKLRPPLPSI